MRNRKLVPTVSTLEDRISLSDVPMAAPKPPAPIPADQSVLELLKKNPELMMPIDDDYFDGVGGAEGSW